MDPLTIAAIGGGAAKLASGLFGESPAEKRRKAIARRRQQLQEQQKQDIATTYQRNANMIGQRIGSARQRAGEQAIALGRPQDVGSMLIPLETNLTQIGAENTRNTLDDINQNYRSQYSQLDNADLDIAADETTPLDYFGEMGGAVANYALQRQGLEDQYDTLLSGDVLGSAASIAQTPQFDYGYQGGVYSEFNGISEAEKHRNYRAEKLLPLKKMTPAYGGFSRRPRRF